MITVNFVDYMRKETAGYEILRPAGSGDYLFLCFPLPMRFSHMVPAPGQEILLTQKHACILLAPGDAHWFCGNPEFLNSFIHFNDPQDQVGRFGVPTGRLFYPTGFERLNSAALTIKEELLTGGTLHQEMVHAAMLRLLVWICRDFAQGACDPLKEQFEALRYEMLSDCAREVSVQELAAKMCMSRTSFYKYYSRYFGSSPKQDLLRLRMEKAAVLLTNQQKTVAAVAAETGFKSVEHFARYYKSFYRKPPRG